jgi:transposase
MCSRIPLCSMLWVPSDLHFSAMERFVPSDRNQLFLLPPSLNEWVGEDHLVHFIIESVESMELPALHVNTRGTGSAQYSPKMMLELLIYCYSQGIFSSRKIEMATWGDIYVRFIAANTHPDHDTLAKFRKDNFEAIATCFVEVLKLAKEMKLLKVGTVSVDGTKLKASASKDKNVRYDRAVQLEAQLEADVRSRLHKAETADNMNLDDGRLPKELRRLSVLREKMKAARAELEARAKAREEKKQKELAARKAALGSKDDEEPPSPRRSWPGTMSSAT